MHPNQKSGVHDPNCRVLLDARYTGDKSNHGDRHNPGQNRTDQHSHQMGFLAKNYFHDQVSADHTGQHGMGDGICQKTTFFVIR